MKPVHKCFLFPALSLAIFLSPSCGGRQPAGEHAVTIAVPLAGNDGAPAGECHWIDDFRDFRMAVYHNDLSRLENYFRFPLDPASGIWQLVFLDVEKQPAEASKPFSEKDFGRYHGRIFGPDFLKSVLKLKSEMLVKKNEVETPLLEENGAPFHMYATYMPEQNLLVLNLAYLGGQDEEGNRVSEGEFNILYYFRILGGKRLLFEKVDFAG